MNPEHLGYWYFRLNGFLTTANFVIHPRRGTQQGTDVDVMGVRFPFRQELVINALRDDHVFDSDVPQVIFAEIKTGRCALNGPWTTPARENMQNALAAVGAVPGSEIDSVAEALYESGEARTHGLWFRLICVGSERDEALASTLPAVPQILWREVEAFIFNRFKENIRRKIAHPQWDAAGQRLWEAAMNARDIDAFRRLLDTQRSSAGPD